ncbi:hypothetical protein GCM10010411_22430 [Actinomadura fulvescens]|uniref:Uncharacterized protein n=2 Tax=Actinomadura fulvescens TaxID=46160 RepID=A0ABN3PJA7_9ACTN
MGSLEGRTVIVTGATGNIGALIARTLLERDAAVIAPSRSRERLDDLRAYLGDQVGQDKLSQLRTVIGDVGDDSSAAALGRRIGDQVGGAANGARGVDAMVASLGDFVAAPSLLGASTAELQRALDGYLLAHHRLARTFLPAIAESGGTYLFLQGPLAFDIYPGLGTDLISIATAAQHMLFRALARETEGNSATVAELVTHAMIRDRTAQPGSPIPADAVGPFAVDLLFGSHANLHGQSIHLTSADQTPRASPNL